MCFSSWFSKGRDSGGSDANEGRKEVFPEVNFHKTMSLCDLFCVFPHLMRYIFPLIKANAYVTVFQSAVTCHYISFDPHQIH